MDSSHLYAIAGRLFKAEQARRWQDVISVEAHIRLIADRMLREELQQSVAEARIARLARKVLETPDGSVDPF
jgi:hypothetical protein